MNHIIIEELNIKPILINDRVFGSHGTESWEGGREGGRGEKEEFSSCMTYDDGVVLGRPRFERCQDTQWEAATA